MSDLATEKNASGCVTAGVLREQLVVCMLFFNKLEQTVESVMSFVETGAKVHLLDNGSEPEALRQLRKTFENRPQICIVEAGGNKGVSGGRNLQILGTSEPWILFVDNDITVATLDWIDRLASGMRRYPQAEIYVPRLFNKHEDSWVDPSDFVIDTHGNGAFMTASAGFTNSFPGGAAVVSRQVFERLGLYDEDLFVGFEDFELAIRAVRSGHPLLVRHLDDIDLIHDHRVSTVKADRSAAMVRYDVVRISRSHEVIQKKHGVLLNPNFANWLQEQVQQITGDAEPNVDKIIESRADHHGPYGATMTPRYVGSGRICIFVDGEGNDLWMRLRALDLARDRVRDAGVEVQVVLLAPMLMDPALAICARQAGLVDEVRMVRHPVEQPSAALPNGTFDFVCWLGTGLMSSEFLLRAIQDARFEYMDTSFPGFFHPGRVITAMPEGRCVQWLREEEFNPMVLDHDARLQPMFLVTFSNWQSLILARSVSWAPNWREAVLGWVVASTMAAGARHFGVPGSAAMIVLTM